MERARLTNIADNNKAERTLATIDLGSNSFHMLVARETDGQFQIIEKRGEKVQLAAGLDSDSHLSQEAMQRGWSCLESFAQRLRGMPNDCVSVLATNALRAAKNRLEFIEKADAILGHPIEVIAGREEARLIYSGVSHTLPPSDERRLVIDIGGGSTEFIIGQGGAPKLLESLHMGCVSFTKRYFVNGEISAEHFDHAILASEQVLQSIESEYRALGWQAAIGSSGTVRAVETAVRLMGNEHITLKALMKLKKQLLMFKHVNDVKIEGIKQERRSVFVGGLAILIGAFRALNIDHMMYCDGALREGALWDMVNRDDDTNVCAQSVRLMQERFSVDSAQANRVAKTAKALLKQVASDWALSSTARSRLTWAAQLHEIGLSIAHSGYHKHGAYVLQHADLFGFTNQGQSVLACLVRLHRRKFAKAELDALPSFKRDEAQKLAVLLRLAALLHRSRQDMPSLPCTLSVDTNAKAKAKTSENALTLTFDHDWLSEHPLTAHDLDSEKAYLNAAGIELNVKAQ